MPRQYTRVSLEDRFWSSLDQSAGPAGCWLWLGSKYANGYGRVWDGTAMRLAHRASYELAHGPGSIPPGMDVLHNCYPSPDRKDCVNPAHLWLGTQSDNARDARDKGQARYLYGPDHPMFGVRREFCAKGHALTPDNVVYTDHGKARRCRICYLASTRARTDRYIATHRAEINEAKRRRRAATSRGPAVGEHHGLTTLTEQDVRAIRAASGETTFVELARRYRVSPATIANIVRRRTWRHVTD